MDSADHERIEDTREELFKIVTDPDMKDVVVLIFANKSDLPRALDGDEITERLELRKLRNITWHVQASCATTGDGLVEGMTWISKQIK